MNTIPLINLEFIKLANAMRAAQRKVEERYTRKNITQAKRLEQLFDARLNAYEKQVQRLLKRSDFSRRNT